MKPLVLAAAVALGLVGPALAQQKLAEIPSEGSAKHSSAPFRTDTIEVALGAGGDAGKRHQIEYMVRMKAGDALVYSWEAPADADLWHEFHGHTATG